MKKEENFKSNRPGEFRSETESGEKNQDKNRKPQRNDDRIEGMDEDMEAQNEGNYGHKSQQQAEEDGRKGENHD